MLLHYCMFTFVGVGVINKLINVRAQSFKGYIEQANRYQIIMMKLSYKPFQFQHIKNQ